MVIPVLQSLMAVFPSWAVIAFMSVIVLALLILVIKIVGFVLDAIPFL